MKLPGGLPAHGFEPFVGDDGVTALIGMHGFATDLIRINVLEDVLVGLVCVNDFGLVLTTHGSDGLHIAGQMFKDQAAERVGFGVQ